jgi:hypothetical protein
MKVDTVFREVNPFSLTDPYYYFGGRDIHNVQSALYPEAGGMTFIRYLRDCWPDYKATRAVIITKTRSSNLSELRNFKLHSSSHSDLFNNCQRLRLYTKPNDRIIGVMNMMKSAMRKLWEEEIVTSLEAGEVSNVTKNSSQDC